ncbi:MAG: ABC transporter substrate binding protein [Chloroflexota bacterium]|nr:ABC transporter substrate binding protein [Chloroflexota bacterium]
MARRFLLIIAVLSLCASATLWAQDDEKPTVAILRLGDFASVVATESAILDVLQARGFIDSEERAMTAPHQDLQGENINIVWGNADFDLSLVPIMIDNAIDQDADVLLTITTMVTMAAVDATLDMDDPPAVLFTSVSTPYYSGIAEAPCIKPDHVAGFQVRVPYEEIVPMLLSHNADLKTIGTIFQSTSLPGAFGVESIEQIADELGLMVETTAIAALPDLRAATQGLIDKGVEAILLPADNSIGLGMPIIAGTALPYGIPVYHAVSGGVALGATFGIGAYRHYQEGVDAGRVLSAYLNGDIDFATTAIGSIDGVAIGLNVDLARAGNIPITDELLATADLAVDGEMLQLSPRMLEDYLIGLEPAAVLGIMEAAAAALPNVEFAAGKLILPVDSLDSIVESAAAFLAASGGGSPDDTAFLESLRCTDEMIAEQQAALTASGA